MILIDIVKDSLSQGAVMPFDPERKVLFIMVIIPATALLAGAVPFLDRVRPQLVAR